MGNTRARKSTDLVCFLGNADAKTGMIPSRDKMPAIWG